MREDVTLNGGGGSEGKAIRPRSGANDTSAKLNFHLFTYRCSLTSPRIAGRVTELRGALAAAEALGRAARPLLCSVVAAGGSNIVRRTFWSGNVRHVGGCSVAWVAIDERGGVSRRE